MVKAWTTEELAIIIAARPGNRTKHNEIERLLREQQRIRLDSKIYRYEGGVWVEENDSSRKDRIVNEIARN